MLGRPSYRQAMRARREPTRQHLQVNDRDLALERIVAVAPGSGMPTGPVSVTDGTGSCTAALADDGTASCSFTPTTVGVVTITATYGGDPAFTGSVTTAAHPVAKN